MPLKYYLTDNVITPDPDDCRAVPILNDSLSLEHVLDEMISRGSTVTKAEALSVFEELTRAIEVLVKNGNSVKTPLFNISPSIVGVFANADAGFDSAKHKVKLRIRPGVRLSEMEGVITVEKTVGEKSVPVLIHYIDNTTETQDEFITPGGGARITGAALKFDEADPQQGIFFVNVSNGTATRANGKSLKNKPSELIFITPSELVSGSYRIEVRSIFAGTKGVRTGAFLDELTVA